MKIYIVKVWQNATWIGATFAVKAASEEDATSKAIDMFIKDVYGVNAKSPIESKVLTLDKDVTIITIDD